MHSVKHFVLIAMSIGSLSLVKVQPVKADIFDLLRESATCDAECYRQSSELHAQFLYGKPYKHSYIDTGTKGNATAKCNQDRTVGRLRCLQELIDKAEKKELEIETKAGTMAAQDKVYGRIDPYNIKETELLQSHIGAEINQLVEEQRAEALRKNPQASVSRIYSPAANNALVVEQYLDLQKHPSSYRKAFCKDATMYSKKAICRVIEAALADELER